MEIISPVIQAYKLLGGQAAMARLMRISSVTVHEWKQGKRPVPPKRCVQIEQFTNGVVKRQQLRPDDYLEHWPELAQAHANIAQAATENVATSGQGA